MYCIFPYIVFFFCKHVACYLRKHIVFRAIILKTIYKSFIKKWSQQENERKAELHTGCSSFFHIHFFAKIMLLVQGTILSSRQIVTCKQHFPSTTIFLSKECCNDHQPLHIFTAILNVNHTLHIE